MPNIFSKIISAVSNSFSKKGKALSIAPATMSDIYTGMTIGDAKERVLKKKGLGFDSLRKIADYDAVIRICITVIKKAVTQAEWDIIPKQEMPINKGHIKWAKDFFTTVNTNGDNLRELLECTIEDLLVLDAGVWEKLYTVKGELIGLNAVDGATIRPVYNQFGEMDPAKAYVQMIGGKEVASFEAKEIVYMMQNPQNDIEHFGYGKSPIESILLAVQASLNADVYNANIFMKDNIPPGMIDLGNMSEPEARKLIALWNKTTINNTQRMKFIYGSDQPKKYTPFQQNNKDMQYIEYTNWLARIKLATYGLSTLDANITQDVNRSTAAVQASLSNARGVRSIKKLIEEYIEREIFMPMGMDDIEFKFEEADSMEDTKMQAEIDQIYINTGVYTPEDVTIREGYSVTPNDTITDDYISNIGEEAPVEAPPEGEPEDILEDGSAQKTFKKKYFKPLYK